MSELHTDPVLVGERGGKNTLGRPGFAIISSYKFSWERKQGSYHDLHLLVVF